MNLDFNKDPHRRLNLLTGEWVQVSPHRTKRPWQGQVEDADTSSKPKFDKNCYLCPRNERAGGKKNPDYTSTFSFVNDFSALMEHYPSAQINDSDLLVAKGERGICKVICF